MSQQKKPVEPKPVTAAQFVKRAKSRRTVTRDIPGIGPVKLQKLTVGEYDECIELAKVRDNDGNLVLDNAGNVQVDEDKRATLLLIAQIAEPALTLEQVGSIDDFDVDTYLSLRAALAELGIRQEEAEARFPDGPTAAGEVPQG
jgi:hypothetical protein